MSALSASMPPGEGGLIPTTFAAATSFSNTAVNHLRANVNDYFAEPDESIRTLNSFGHRMITRARTHGGDALILVEALDPESEAALTWNSRNRQFAMEWTGTTREDDEDYGGGLKAKKSRGSTMLEKYSAARQRILGSKPAARAIAWDIWALEHMVEFVEKYENWKRQYEMVDFCDQLDIPLREKMPPPFHVNTLFVDEAQDLSPLMMALVRMWRDEYGTTLIMAGDDDQSINDQLNGANPAIWIDTEQVDQSVVLPQSYRVSIEVHAVAHNIIKRVKNRVPKEWKPAAHHGTLELANERAGFGYGKLDEKEPARTAARIAEREAAGQSVMMLATCAYMLAPVTDQLRKLGVLFHNPYRPQNTKWNPLGTRGTSTLSKLIYLETHPLTWQAAAYVDSLCNNPVGGGLFHSAASVRQRVRAMSAAELATIVTEPIFRDYGLTLFVENPRDYLRQHGKTAYARSLDYAEAVATRYGVENIPAEPSVIVGTIFSVKGGEADHVVIAPDLSPAGYKQYQINPDSGSRLFYVGVTRAKHGLTVLRPTDKYNVQVLNERLLERIKETTG